MAKLTLRGVKGDLLTYQELDSNFLALDSDIGILQGNYVTLDTNQTITGAKTLSATLTAQNIIPSADSAYDLGSAGAKWKDLYLSGTTIYLGSIILKDSAGSLAVYDSVGTAKSPFTGATVTATTGFMPDANDGAYLGQSGTAFSDLYLASGGVINWNAGDVTLTHSANALAFAGASSGYTFDAVTTIASDLALNAGSITSVSGAISFGNENLSTTGTLASGALTVTGAVLANADDGGALGASGTGWSDLFLASGGVINWNAGDVTATHSANTLAFAGASSGYTFDAVMSDDLGELRQLPTPDAAKTTSYSLDAGDVGVAVLIGTGGSITIPDATLAADDVISLVNQTSGGITLTCSITTAYVAGADVATATLSAYGTATIVFTSGTVCHIVGDVS